MNYIKSEGIRWWLNRLVFLASHTWSMTVSTRTIQKMSANKQGTSFALDKVNWTILFTQVQKQLATAFIFWEREKKYVIKFEMSSSLGCESQISHILRQRYNHYVHHYLSLQVNHYSIEMIVVRQCRVAKKISLSRYFLQYQVFTTHSHSISCKWSR
jgi:hypothetical protein